MIATRYAAAMVVILFAVGCVAHRPEPADPGVVAETQQEQHSATTGELTTSTRDAESAAVRFVSSGQLLLDTPPEDLPEVVRELWSTSAVDDALAETVEQLRELRDRIGDGSGPTRFRQSVLATRTSASTDTRAEVALWWVGVLSREGSAQPQAQWTTTTLTLVLEDGMWRVEEESSEPGPVPDHSSDSEPITHAEFERRLAGFEDWEATR